MKKALLLIAAMAIVVMCSKEDYQERVFPTTITIPQGFWDASSLSSKAERDSLLDESWTLLPKSYFIETGFRLPKRNGELFTPGSAYSTYSSQDRGMIVNYKGNGRFYAWKVTDDGVVNTGRGFNSMFDLFDSYLPYELETLPDNELANKIANYDITGSANDEMKDALRLVLYRFITKGSEHGLDLKGVLELPIEVRSYKWKSRTIASSGGGYCQDYKILLFMDEEQMLAQPWKRQVQTLTHELGHDILNLRHSNVDYRIMNTSGNGEYGYTLPIPIEEAVDTMFEEYVEDSLPRDAKCPQYGLTN